MTCTTTAYYPGHAGYDPSVDRCRDDCGRFASCDDYATCDYEEEEDECDCGCDDEEEGQPVSHYGLSYAGWCHLPYQLQLRYS